MAEQDKKKPGLKYSKDLAQEAAAKHEFVVVRTLDDKGNAVTSKSGNRKVTGLPNFLLKPKNSNIIYNFKYRITGTESDITEAMELAGFTDDQISEAVAGHRAVDYITVNEPEAQAMIRKEKDVAKKSPDTYDTDLTLDDLTFLGYKIAASTTQVPIKGAKPSSPKKAKGTGRRGGAIKGNLKERADNCGGADKALNVSGLKSDMSGAKACYKPRANAKTMVYLPEHNIVSSNIEGVKLYFQLIDADKGVASAAVAEWKSMKDDMDSKKSARSPRSKGEPVKLPPGARAKKVTSPARAQSPRTPVARSPREGRAVPADVVGRPASPSASRRGASARSPGRDSGSLQPSGSTMPRRMPTAGGLGVAGAPAAAASRRPASPSGGAYTGRRPNRLERM